MEPPSAPPLRENQNRPLWCNQIVPCFETCSRGSCRSLRFWLIHDVFELNRCIAHLRCQCLVAYVLRFYDKPVTSRLHLDFSNERMPAAWLSSCLRVQWFAQHLCFHILGTFRSNRLLLQCFLPEINRVVRQPNENKWHRQDLHLIPCENHFPSFFYSNHWTVEQASVESLLRNKCTIP